jgi:hypothetical protein
MLPGGLTAPGTEAGGQTVSPGGQTTPRIKAWMVRPSAPHDPIIGCLADFLHNPCDASCGAHDFDCTPCGTHTSTCATHGHGVHDFARASHSSGVPPLLTSSSGCAGATYTTSTSIVTAGEGHTGGTSGQPSSDDHTGKAGLLTTDQQTHTVDHLIITALSGAHLSPPGPCRPILASCHGGRI